MPNMATGMWPASAGENANPIIGGLKIGALRGPDPRSGVGCRADDYITKPFAWKNSCARPRQSAPSSDRSVGVQGRSSSDFQHDPGARSVSRKRNRAIHPRPRVLFARVFRSPRRKVVTHRRPCLGAVGAVKATAQFSIFA